MPRPRNPFPNPRCHKGRAVVDVYDGGRRRTVTLGPWGSPEAEQEFARLMAERHVPGHPIASARTGVTVNELLLAFMRWAAIHYRTPEGKPTTEIGELKWSLRPVRELYGHLLAAEFGPRALAAVRQHMIGLGWCRTLINRRVERVRRAFRWAAAEELIPVTAYQALRTLPGLQKGRTDARESDPVKPVPLERVQATLPHLSRHVRAMVELQLHTGMRPGEICGLTFAEVERSGELWVYRPTRHKTAHRGKERVVFFGPKARAVLLAFLVNGNSPPEGFTHIELNNPEQSTARLIAADAYQEAGRRHDAELLRNVAKPQAFVAGCVVDPTAPVFSPARERDERFRRMRAARKSKVTPSQLSRRKANPKRQPSSVYHPHAYSAAIEKACKREGLEHWHPNQIRHLHATEVRKEYGVEGAQVALGHATASVTQVYAERDQSLAAKIASEMG